MQLILYYAPVTCALVPYVTLSEAEAPFEVRPLNFGTSQHLAPEYLAVNPKHKVPVLVIDGQPLSENVAIQIWIARNFPAAKLLPSSPMQELQAISLLAWCSSGLNRCGGSLASSCSKTTGSRTTCWPAGNFSLTTSRRSTRTSSGAFVAARSSISTSPSSGIAWHILS